MTNGQLTAILCTAASLVLAVLLYPAVHKELTTYTPSPIACTVVSETMSTADYNEYIEDNGVAPYVQTQCESATN